MKKYEKWRELLTDPYYISFKNLKLKEIINYLPAGNDVLECLFEFQNRKQKLFLKIERSKVVDFETEVKNLNILHNEYHYNNISRVIEDGYTNDKKYIVLEKMNGERLSEIISKGISDETKKEYLIKYGKELAKIHKLSPDLFTKSKQRIINSIPMLNTYNEFDPVIQKYINYLNDNSFDIKLETFIHGDFHYANILWDNEEISAILDWEYSGLGLKEQDIAWACVLRPTQKFLTTTTEIKELIEGYKSETEFDFNKFKWCLINAYCHFYLMNQENNEYTSVLINNLKEIILWEEI